MVWILLALGSGWADRQILAPRGRVLRTGQFVVEGIHREGDQGYIRYYFANVGLGKGWEAEVARMDYERGTDVNRLSLQYQYQSESALMPGFTVGVWDLANQKDKGLGRSFYVVMGQTMATPGRKGESVYEYLAWGTGQLRGFWGGVEWRSQPLRLSLAMEHDPITGGMNWEGRYEHPSGFRLKVGLYRGDMAFGISYAKGLW